MPAMAEPVVVEAGPRSTFTSTIRLRLRVPAKLRNLELGLLIVAIVIDVGAVALVQLGAVNELRESVLALMLGLGILALGMHVTMRLVSPDADPFILPIIMVLNGLGIAMIYRIGLADQLEGWENAGVRQIAWTAVAIVIAIAVLVIVRNHRVLQRYRYVAMFSGIVLLLLPMLPVIGSVQNGARLWIQLGPFSFQPGELAKVALAIFFAGYLVTARDSLSMVGPKVLGIRFPRARDLGPLLVVFAASMLVLVVQRDLGTALLYFGLFLVMLYVATGRASWIILGLLLFFAGAFAASQVLSYVNGRFTAWLDAFNPAIYDAEGGSYQLVQGMFGLADGGLLGMGLGRGRPDITPLAESDYIISALGEELGLIGLFAILALYLLLVSRGFRIGFAGQDDFGRLLGVGLSFVIALQVFVVIGGVTRVIPLTGLTTPWLAAGGSSLVANWIIAALLLRLSDSVRNQPRLVLDEADAARPVGRAWWWANEPRAEAGQHRRAADVPVAVRLEHRHPGLRLRRAQGGRPQRPDHLRQLLRRARPDPRRRQSHRRVGAQRRRVQVPARLPGRGGVLRDHRVPHPVRRTHRHRGRDERRAQRHRQPAVPRSAEPDHHRPDPEGRRRRAHHQPGRAAGRLGSARRSRPHRRGDRARPQDRRDPGDGLESHVRPERARQPRHRDRGCAVPGAAERCRRSAHQPHDRRRPRPARVDLQARDRLRPPSRTGSARTRSSPTRRACSCRRATA